MNLDVVFLPQLLSSIHLADRTVAVFDVLRATTTMTAALAAGVAEIRLYGDVESARQAAGVAADTRPLLMGEHQCLPPAGFDLGNSPGALNAKHSGRTAFMSTTNGTRAMLAARGSRLRVAASLVNAAAVAKTLIRANRDVTLLCAGTGGQVAKEDVLGCGAVIAAINATGTAPRLGGDAARIAASLFAGARGRLRDELADSDGGRNVIAAGLAADIDFCARLDVFDVVGVVEGDEPIVRRALP